MKLSDIGEFGFIDIIESHGLIRSEGVIKGIGDDCAVIRQPDGECLLVTTDLLVESVHFILESTTAEQLGEKALAVNLSDIAACGGDPRDAFISLACPDGIELEWLEGFYQGMRSMARTFDVNLLGGDTTKSKHGLVINVAVTGIAPENELLLRNGGRPGDLLIVTGMLGESAAGLELILKQSHGISAEIYERLVSAHLTPQPHVLQGRFLAKSGFCTAAIDVSDGLSSDLWHICRQSGVGAIVKEEALPISRELYTAGSFLGIDPKKWILDGGEDYVLLAAVRPNSLERLIEEFNISESNLIPIGELTSSGRMELLENTGKIRDIKPQGWDHFIRGTTEE